MGVGVVPVMTVCWVSVPFNRGSSGLQSLEVMETVFWRSISIPAPHQNEKRSVDVALNVEVSTPVLTSRK